MKLLNLITIISALSATPSDTLRVAFWNLENFYDTAVDTTRAYNEFTPDGTQHWTVSRFYRKRNNIYKAILSLSGNEPLAVMGVAEVENRYVMEMIFNQTPLKAHNYKVIHYECDDRRGIDVAMAYSIDKVQLVSSEAVKVRDPDNKRFRTRDILYAKFYDRHGDTLHCFVNHWPSRYSGEKETIRLRCLAASTVRRMVDSLCEGRGYVPKIVIMGDLNDTPDDPSVRSVLGAKSLKETARDDILINLFAEGCGLGFKGTLKHQYYWHVFDQIIVSRSLVYGRKNLRYLSGSATIFHADFMLKDDETYNGVKLFRTYVGPNYLGGFSDHLPVFIDIVNIF